MNLRKPKTKRILETRFTPLQHTCHLYPVLQLVLPNKCPLYKLRHSMQKKSNKCINEVLNNLMIEEYEKNNKYESPVKKEHLNSFHNAYFEKFKTVQSSLNKLLEPHPFQVNKFNLVKSNKTKMVDLKSSMSNYTYDLSMKSHRSKSIDNYSKITEKTDKSGPEDNFDQEIDTFLKSNGDKHFKIYKTHIPMILEKVKIDSDGYILNSLNLREDNQFEIQFNSSSFGHSRAVSRESKSRAQKIEQQMQLFNVNKVHSNSSSPQKHNPKPNSDQNLESPSRKTKINTNTAKDFNVDAKLHSYKFYSEENKSMKKNFSTDNIINKVENQNSQNKNNSNSCDTINEIREVHGVKNYTNGNPFLLDTQKHRLYSRLASDLVSNNVGGVNQVTDTLNHIKSHSDMRADYKPRTSDFKQNMGVSSPNELIYESSDNQNKMDNIWSDNPEINEINEITSSQDSNLGKLSLYSKNTNVKIKQLKMSRTAFNHNEIGKKLMTVYQNYKDGQHTGNKQQTFYKHYESVGMLPDVEPLGTKEQYLNTYITKFKSQSSLRDKKLYAEHDINKNSKESVKFVPLKGKRTLVNKKKHESGEICSWDSPEKDDIVYLKKIID